MTSIEIVEWRFVDFKRARRAEPGGRRLLLPAVASSAPSSAELWPARPTCPGPLHRRRRRWPAAARPATSSAIPDSLPGRRPPGRAGTALRAGEIITSQHRRGAAARAALLRRGLSDGLGAATVAVTVAARWPPLLLRLQRRDDGLVLGCAPWSLPGLRTLVVPGGRWASRSVVAGRGSAAGAHLASRRLLLLGAGWIGTTGRRFLAGFASAEASRLLGRSVQAARPERSALPRLLVLILCPGLFLFCSCSSSSTLIGRGRCCCCTGCACSAAGGCRLRRSCRSGAACSAGVRLRTAVVREPAESGGGPPAARRGRLRCRSLAGSCSCP